MDCNATVTILLTGSTDSNPTNQLRPDFFLLVDLRIDLGSGDGEKDWSFSELFFFKISPEQIVKLVNQQSVLNLQMFHNFP